MKWSEEVWSKIAPVYSSMLDMDFIKELAAGTLSRERFRFYIMQDSLYLEHFGRALALIGVKVSDIETALAYIRFAENAIVVENILHDSFFKDFGITNKGIIQPACHHYIHYLRSTVALEAVEIGMAATLPCFWIYKKVGDYILQQYKECENPYQRWIETYAGDEFGTAVQKVIELCDKAAEAATSEVRVRMTDAFITSSFLEYNFWDAAYELKKWK